MVADEAAHTDMCEIHRWLSTTKQQIKQTSQQKRLNIPWNAQHLIFLTIRTQFSSICFFLLL